MFLQGSGPIGPASLLVGADGGHTGPDRLSFQSSPRQWWGHTYTEKSFLVYLKFKVNGVFHLAALHDKGFSA